MLTTSGYSKDELVQKLADTIEEAKKTFLETPLEELLRKRSVQGFEFSGVGNIIHVSRAFILSYGTDCAVDQNIEQCRFRFL